MAVKDFGGLHECFGERRVRMDGLREVFGGRAHFDGECAFADEFAGAMADDPDAQDALGLRVDDQFGEAFGTIEGQSTARSTPREFGNFDFDFFGAGFGFGKASPGYFGFGKNHGGYHD